MDSEKYHYNTRSKKNKHKKKRKRSITSDESSTSSDIDEHGNIKGLIDYDCNDEFNKNELYSELFKLSKGRISMVQNIIYHIFLYRFYQAYRDKIQHNLIVIKKKFMVEFFWILFARPLEY